MAKLYQFLLNDTIYQDPDNWTDFIPERSRHDIYKTLLSTYSKRQVVLIKDAKTYVDTLWSESGVKAQCTFDRKRYNPSTGSYDLESMAEIDFSQYEKGKVRTKVGVQPSSFIQKILSRDQIKTPLQELKDIDGDAITTFTNETLDLTLDAQELIELYEATHEDTGSETETGDEEDEQLTYFAFSADEVAVEEVELIETAVTKEYVTNILPVQQYEVVKEGDIDVTIDCKIKVEIIGGTYGGGSAVAPTAKLKLNGTTLQTVTFPTSGMDESMDLTYSGTTTLATSPGDDIKFYLDLDKGDDPVAIGGWAGQWKITVFTSAAGYHFQVNMQQNTTYPDTTCKGMLAWEYFLRMAQKITGRNDCLRSSVLGRTDGEVYTYDSDGDLSLIHVSNGFQVRQYPIEDYPIISYLREGFQEFNTQTPLGLGVTYEEGVPYIIIEKLSYFLDTSNVMMTINADKDGVRITPSLDYTYSKVKCGYKNYEKEENNTLGTAHSPREYTTGLDQVMSNTYEIESNVVASGHLIERIRREPYSEATKKDSKFDKKLVFIKVQRTESGFEREKDDDFDTISNVENSDTQYNLKLTPANIVMNHAPFILSGYSKLLVDEDEDELFLRFQSGEANIKLETTQTGKSLIKEGDDLKRIDLEDENYDPWFDGEMIEVSSVITKDQKSLLDSEVTGVINVVDGETTYTGFPEFVKVKNLKNNKVEIKLLKIFSNA